MQQDRSLESTPWQASLNPALLQRLLRSMQPGMMRAQFVQQVIGRIQRLGDRLPLLAQYTQRQEGITSLQVNQPPIVYAHPPAQVEPQLGNKISTASQQPSMPTTQPGSPTVIQAKFADSNTASAVLKSPTVVQAKFTDSNTASAPSKSPAVVQAKLSRTPEIAPVAPTSPSAILTSEPLSAFDDLPLPSSSTALIASIDPSDTQTNLIKSPKVVRETRVPTSELLSTLAFTQSSPFEPSSSKSKTGAVASPEAKPRPIVPAHQRTTAGFQTERPVNLIWPDQTSTAIPSQSLSDAVDSLATSPANLRSPQAPAAPDTSRPIVQVSRGSRQTLPLGSQTAPQQVPLVFTNPLALAAQTYLDQETQKKQQSQASVGTTINSQRAGTYPLVSQPSTALPATQQQLSNEKAQPVVDVEAITKQVERRLMQRLTIESERRGKTKWH